MSKVQVGIHNGTDHDIVLKNRTHLGVLEAVKSVTAADVRLSENRVAMNLLWRINIRELKRKLYPASRTKSVKTLSQQLILVAWTMISVLWLRQEFESSSSSEDGTGCIPGLEIEINLSDHRPVQTKYTSVPRLLNPVVCVRKKDGTLRLCIDYSELNRRTVADRHPTPRVQGTLHSLFGNTWFNVLDQGKAYHQGFVRQPQHSSHHGGLYEYIKIPSGLMNAPANFQQFMEQCLGELRDKVAIP